MYTATCKPALVLIAILTLTACGGSGSDVAVTTTGGTTGTTTGGDTAGNTGGNDTSGAETAGNETAGTETAGTETAGSETAGESSAGETTGGTATGGDTGNPPVADASPNFLLIITDDQGLDASAQYSFSNDLPNTPVIDDLASNGVVFDNMWATPSCTTTRGSLLTGLHGVNSGVDTTPSLMDTSLLTVQKYLGDNAGYESAVFGKWHVAGGGNSSPTHPNESGVDYYAGNIAGTVDDYESWPLVINGQQQTSSVYHTTAITDLAIDWIEQQDGPWFSWVAYVAPHSPFHLPPDDLHNRTLSGTPADIDGNTREYYLAAIEAMDTEIGRLVDSLESDVRDNTLIMVLGDNGTPRAIIDTAAFPRTHGKSSLYEGGIRVPFVVSGPLVASSNIRESAMVNTVDLLPTLSEAAGLQAPAAIDGVSFYEQLTSGNGSTRQYNYSEFIGDTTNGWAVRDSTLKLIEFADGTRELYDVNADIREETNLIAQSQYADRVAELSAFAAAVRSGSGEGIATGDSETVDITDSLLTNTSANCADYAASYESRVLDVNNNTEFAGDLRIETDNNTCTFITNAIPNHDFNDGARGFPNDVSAQDDRYTVTANPTVAATSTPLSLTMDNAILLNGVKVDLLAAACFGVGDERTGCGDPDQPWRFDPMFSANGFRVDTHNAHTQPDGTYHYHGVPNALFDSDATTESPLVGFAADGFPIYGSNFNDGGTIRKATSSYRLKTAARPEGDGNPGGIPDGTYRDDYEYVEGLGDLDECNGMMVNGVYGYYMIDEFPYILGCFSGTPDGSFFK